MNSHRNSITKKVVSAMLRIILIALIALVVCTFFNVQAEKAWDVEYPMANAKVTWQQSYHSGGWEVNP